MNRNLTTRRQILLTPNQDRELKRIAELRGISVCRLIRHAINNHLLERKIK